MNIENIPPELILEIFSRLTVRSLCLAKSVCKYWYDLIREPRLPHMHFDQNEEEALILALYFYVRPGEYRTTLCLSEHHFSPTPIFKSSGWWDIHSSFNGLLLAYNLGDQRTFVSNPLTGDHIDLPPSKDTILWNCVNSRAHFGLGFDSSIGKYKVVCAYFGAFLFDNRRCQMGAQVYTIDGAASSSWRDIVSQPTVGIYVVKMSVYVRGARHWITDDSKYGDMGTMVISFDFEKEEFKTLPCSGFFSVANRHKFSLIDLRGCLGMVDSSHSDRIDIWKLKDFERNEWVTEYRIGLDFHTIVLGLIGEDEILMLKDSHETDVARNAHEMSVFDEDAIVVADTEQSALVAYNPKMDTLRNIRRFYNVNHAFLHRPSLLSLPSPLPTCRLSISKRDQNRDVRSPAVGQTSQASGADVAGVP